MFSDEVKDATYHDALVVLIKELINLVVGQTGIDNDSLDRLMLAFAETLPRNLSSLLRRNFLATS